MRSTPVVFLSALTSLFALGCSGESPTVADHHGTEGVGSTSQALVGTDPVSAAVTDSCSTSVVKGLAVQLVQEIECLRPKTMKRIDGLSGISLGTSAAAVPYLQVPAADALVRAQKARGSTMQVNSGLRTLPQQYLLYRWYQLGRCGIGLAASPGTSNHESALAVDIDDNTGWRSAMEKNSFTWLGSKDPVHFNYTGTGAVSLSGLSVKAFQRLWNRNNPTDRIDEDGSYGPATEARLKKSPIGGFKLGALTSCGTTPGDAGVSDSGKSDAVASDAGADDSAVSDASSDDTGEPMPEGEEPNEDASPSDDPKLPTRDAGTDDSGGCSASPTHAPNSGGLGLGALAIAMALAVRARRGRAQQ